MSPSALRRPWVAALAVYLVITAILCWPVPIDWTHHAYGSVFGDAGSTVGLFDSWRRTLLAGHPGFDPGLGYPFGVDWHQIPILPLPWALQILLALVVGPMAGYNLVIVSSFPASAMAARGLARDLGHAPLVAGLAGLIYGFSAYHLGHGDGHVALAHTEWFPLLLLGLLRWYRQATLRRLALPVGIMAVIALWDVYYTVFACILIGSFIAVAGWRRLHSEGRAAGVKVAAAGVGVVVAGALIALPVQALVNRHLNTGQFLFDRSSAEELVYSARACQLLSPWYANPRLGGLGCRIAGVSIAEHALYLGWVTLALALVGVISWWRRRRSAEVAMPVAIAFVIAGLAWAAPAVWDRLVGFSPVRVANILLPGLRVSSRSVVLVQLGLALLAAAGLTALIRRRPPRVAAALVVVLGAMSLIESTGLSDRVTSWDIPPVYGWLATQPADGVVAEYPLVASESPVYGAELFWRLSDHRPRVGLNLGQGQAEDLRVELSHVGPDLPAELAAIGVSVAVDHSGRTYFMPGPDSPTLSGLPGLRAVWQGAGDVAYRVAAPARPFAYLAGHFYGAEARPDGGYGRWMAESGQLALVNPTASAASVALTLELHCLGPGCADRVTLRGLGFSVGLDSSDALVTSRVVLQLPPGTSLMQLLPAVPARAISAGDGRRVTVFVLRPRLTASD